MKSSTSAKDYHRDDAAIQAFVAQEAGVKLAQIAIAHVNADFKTVLTEFASDTNALTRLRGLVLDLRFASGNDYAAGIYVVIAAVVSLLTVLTMRESAGRPLAALGAPRAGLTAPTGA